MSEIISVKKEGSLIVISGPSGVGKDTICKKILDKNKNYWLSVSATTRKPRIKEIDGIDYFFKTIDEFKNMIRNKELLEYAVVHETSYYGTPKKPILDKLKQGIDVILQIDIQGAIQIKENYPEAIFIFIMPPSIQTLMKRLIDRNTETKEQLLHRFQSLYKEVNALSNYNYVVINDEVELCANKIEAIITTSKCRVDRIEQLNLDTKEEEIHEWLTKEKS